KLLLTRVFRRECAGPLTLVTLAVVFVAEQHRDLVLRRCLPGQTKRFVDVEVVLVARPAEILRVEQRALPILELVEIESGQGSGRNPRPPPSVEPPLVAADR